jgi:predicted transcriptional regulator
MIDVQTPNPRLCRPRIETPILPQTKIQDVLDRPNVQRTLSWLAKQSDISQTLLHQIVNGKRRLKNKQADKILFTLQTFNIDVTYDEVFI